MPFICYLCGNSAGILKATNTEANPIPAPLGYSAEEGAKAF